MLMSRRRRTGNRLSISKFKTPPNFARAAAADGACLLILFASSFPVARNLAPTSTALARAKATYTLLISDPAGASWNPRPALTRLQPFFDLTERRQRLAPFLRAVLINTSAAPALETPLPLAPDQGHESTLVGGSRTASRLVAMEGGKVRAASVYRRLPSLPRGPSALSLAHARAQPPTPLNTHNRRARGTPTRMSCSTTGRCGSRSASGAREANSISNGHLRPGAGWADRSGANRARLPPRQSRSGQLWARLRFIYPLGASKRPPRLIRGADSAAPAAAAAATAVGARGVRAQPTPPSIGVGAGETQQRPPPPDRPPGPRRPALSAA